MEPTFRRRRFLSVALAVPAVGLLAACGSDSSRDTLTSSDSTDQPPATVAGPDTDSTTTPAETVPAETVPAESAPTTDAAAAEPVLSYTTPGGFTTAQFAFQDPPVALLSSDGTLIGPGFSTAIYPGPLLPVHQVQTVTPAGIESLLAAADAAGLLADIDYSTDSPIAIADAATSVLTITANGETYTHEAYALGIASGPGTEPSESTPERQVLFDFLTTLQSDPASIFGAENLGEATVYQPTAYQFTAMPMAGAEVAADATIVEWPAETGVDLATVTDCEEVDRSVVGDLFEQANQLTIFTQDGVNYQVTPRPAYPGRSC